MRFFICFYDIYAKSNNIRDILSHISLPGSNRSQNLRLLVNILEFVQFKSNYELLASDTKIMYDIETPALWINKF